MDKKIRSELIKMVVIMTVFVGLGVYAHDFVIAGIKAKMALNLTIFALTAVAAFISFRNVLSLKNEVLALRALQVDFGGGRPGGDDDVYDQPAKLFYEPALLGQGYRLITEQLSKDDSFQLSSGTVESLVHSVDQRINERKSVVGYFSGLMVILGLLGAFMGLMHTVGSVSDLIGGMDVSGTGGNDSFGKMIEGMKAPLSGMSVGFSSSLFGLSTSMVLGALERCMTAAAKSLRDEYEHWLSHMAMLEAGKEDDLRHQDLHHLANIVAASADQIQRFSRAMEDGMRREQATQQTLADLHIIVERLASSVERVTDPAPYVAPIVHAMTELGRSQTRLTAEMEMAFELGREDRSYIRQVLETLQDDRAAAMSTDRQADILARLDKIVACNETALDRPPVVIPWPNGNGATVNADGGDGIKSLQARIASFFASDDDMNRERRRNHQLRKQVETLIQEHRATLRDMEQNFSLLRDGIVAENDAAADLLAKIALDHDRLAVLADLIAEPASEESPAESLERARAHMNLINIQAEKLGFDGEVSPHRKRFKFRRKG